MFVRRKKNKSGTISVQVIDKSAGTYNVIKTMGCSREPSQIQELVKQARRFIDHRHKQGSFDYITGDDHYFLEQLRQRIDQVQLIGPELVLGQLFNQIGFDRIGDELFRDLVITRLIYPASKLKTLDYIARYRGIQYDKDYLYRQLDKLHSRWIERVKKISFEHTVEILEAELHVVFFDVTTLYFEAEQEDDLRRAGFSKDGKHQHPQIVLALLVSYDGYPLDYAIFEGNTFEGKTMLPVLQAFQKRYNLPRLIVVADAAMMSKKNLEELQQKNYQYIIGARIKNESAAIRNRILSLELGDGQSAVIAKDNGDRLLISYSLRRAKKDAHNRRRGLQRLEKRLKRGTLSKDHLNNRGYNKYLILEGQARIRIDYQKFEADEAWDGLKGYITNAELDKEAVIAHYNQLWMIERTFRISKTDLRIRPVYHYKRKRIEAHLCIAFAACKVYKELERQLKQKQSHYSVQQTLEILKSIFGVKVTLPVSGEQKMVPLAKQEDQQYILQLFSINL